MNIGVLQLPDQNAQTLSPVTTGLQNAMQRNLLIQERMKNRQLMPYLAPQAQAGINLQKAQTQNTLAEAARTQFMVNNPGFMGGDASKELAALIQMGLVNPSDIRAGNNQPSSALPLAKKGSMEDLLGNALPSEAPAIASTPQQIGAPQGPSMQPSEPTSLTEAMIQKRQQAEQSPQQQKATMIDAAQQALTSQGPQVAGQPNNAPTASPYDESRPFNSLLPGLNPGVQTLLNQPYAASAYQRQMKAGYSFEKTPQDTKNYMIGMAAANGIDPSEAVNKFANGYTLDDLFKEKGIDRNSSNFVKTPAYSAPQAYVEKIKERQGAEAAVQVLSSAVTDGMGPYARNIMGYSPKQILDSFTGANEEQQIKFVSALMIIPDLINQRIKYAGGNPSEGQYKEILDKSQLDLNLIKAKLTPAQWTAAQKTTDETLSKSLKAQEKTLQVGGKEAPNKSSDDKNVTYEYKDGKLVKTS